MKKDRIQREKVDEAAQKIIKLGRPKLVREHVACIKWKTGAKTVKGNLSSLQTQWKKCQKKPEPSLKKWTQRHEEKLTKLRAEDVRCASDTSLLKRADARKLQFLDDEAKLLTPDARAQLVLSLFESFSETDRNIIEKGL